ncbi:16S rRNA (cytidine(1402)-2'-O)-methyltransferase [Patescibacteria group bacterium]|nr:16S rRNA (cytidine(1402)-2'-O)-methyltransferase [Patescibacteria group bacterium]MBU0777236.1 16S rRNA (cytidine(1402)-2'-O)-methyltransferase [Patescibacteria group bacterium]MBU0845931.1 16S rRNA (cytidine(1402)-2'-O)-methyltransferase [Patescibacteria group bacterium]MBU0922959.1 16S rRNA (cytidine(1402)-2'-O)-methyltransferase [Patescibacteria group bacterium]MBU1066191.1 16S rRNA (cytidine(1402)-2'-O)-methyltransferase [Patescibacteria group bacterium]
MPGTLYIVATPIGNLKDITLRALEILKESDCILAEDTRVTKKLLMYYDIQIHVLSYHQHSQEQKRNEILRLLIEGKNLALVTDAGTPGISDPGNELIAFLLEKEPDIKIVPVPGPSALITALSVSGFRADKFVFLGFLPKKRRSKLFSWLSEGKYTFCFYESPKRILKTLEVLKEEFTDRRVFVARELTKIHESLYRGEISEVIEKLQKDPAKGEIVVVVE